MPNPTIPQHNSHSHWIFYIFLVPVGHGTLLVRFRPLYGQQYVYATRCNSTHASQCAVSSLPNFTNYIATTEGSYTGDVDITRNDDKECSYILGVYSSEATVYQLSVTLANTILVLAPGVPIYDTVSQGDDSYFSFALTGDKLTLMIGLETLTGYVDLYVSTNHTHPNFVNRCREMKFCMEIQLESDKHCICPFIDIYIFFHFILN